MDKVTVIGPYPPPDGGVATFVKQSISILNQKGLEVVLHRVGGREGRTKALQPLDDLTDLWHFLVNPSTRRSQVYHIHTASYWSFYRTVQYIFFISRLNRGKIVLHVHGGAFESFFSELSSPLKLVVRRSLEATDYIIVTSPRWIPVLGKMCDGVPMSSVYNGFDPQLFHPMDSAEARKELGWPMDKRILVSIGHLEEVKGYRYLLESLKELEGTKDDVLTYIVGEGSLRGELSNFIKEQGLEGKVFLLGKQPHEKIPLLLGACDLFILPSLTEGNPVVMFECLGCGRPFVGSAVGGIPDVIMSEDYGLLCQPQDSKALAEVIQAGLSKKWDQEKIAEYARNFTWERISDNLLDIYTKTLEDRGSKGKN